MIHTYDRLVHLFIDFTDPPIVTADPNAPSTQPTTRLPSTSAPTTISWTDLKTTIKGEQSYKWQ